MLLKNFFDGVINSFKIKQWIPLETTKQRFREIK